MNLIFTTIQTEINALYELKKEIAKQYLEVGNSGCRSRIRLPGRCIELPTR